MGFVLEDFHMYLNVRDFHVSEHDTAVGMGPKCVWKFDVKYSHKVEDWLKIKTYCIIKCISDTFKGQRRVFACLFVKYSGLQLCFALITRWDCQQIRIFSLHYWQLLQEDTPQVRFHLSGSGYCHQLLTLLCWAAHMTGNECNSDRAA